MYKYSGLDDATTHTGNAIKTVSGTRHTDKCKQRGIYISNSYYHTDIPSNSQNSYRKNAKTLYTEGMYGKQLTKTQYLHVAYT